jgi:uncharacterized protein (TIGR01777 family)
MKPRIVLAGGTGFIGQYLSPFLVLNNYEIVVLTRSESDHHTRIRKAHWDGKTPGEWIEVVNGAFGIVNLTGRSINCRHTPDNQREIIDSRVDSVRVLGQAIRRCPEPPKVFVQIAAAGIYGDKGERICDETTPPGDDFVSRVCEQWEGAFDAVDAPNTRKVLLRLGVVLAPNGGFLGLLGKLTRWFLGGQVGSGRQYISWIHIADLSRMILASIEREEIIGVFNATSPNPVTNAELMRELRRALHRPWSPPVPEFAARIGSWLIGTEASLALVSQRCIPQRFLDQNFQFEFRNLRQALANIYPAQ